VELDGDVDFKLVKIWKVFERSKGGETKQAGDVECVELGEGGETRERGYFMTVAEGQCFEMDKSGDVFERAKT